MLALTMRALLSDGHDELFRRFMDSVHDYAIFLLTPEGLIASWNVGAERIKGYHADEIIGRHFSVFYPQEALERDVPAQALCTAVQQGQWRDEGWRLRKDGSRFWAHVLISPLLGPTGEVLGFSKVTRDMTEKREGEQRLVEGERNLRLLVETVQDYAIFSLDCHGVITSWNRGAQRIKGYTAQEAVGRHFSMFYEPPDVARGWPQEELERTAEQGRFEDEGWRVRKDGSRFWANVVITAIKDEHGRLLGFSKVTRDLTERRRHEEQLREREESLRLLVEGVRDHAMFLLDAKGRIKAWNAGGQRLLGYDSAQVLEHDVSMFYPEEDRLAGKPQAELASAQSAGHLLVEGWRQRADGTRFWAEVTTTRLEGDGESAAPRGFIRIVRDLTERRRAETLEMEGRRLSEFIAVLSHELRNPLAPIRNAVAILGRFTDEPQARWCLDLLGRQIGHMTRLVDDLLDVSRITSGKIRLEPVALELNTLVRMAVDAASAMVKQHGHSLTVRLAPMPIQIMGDTTRLTQVVANLLTNATKYTPPPGRIDVSVRDDGDVATMQVNDTGIGMSESLLQRAFKPFVQGVRALDRSEGGLGVGLALVKNIVELHGGSVSAASAGTGKGTTITVTLPIRKQAATEPSAAAQTVVVPSPRRVLVVDDHHDVAESLAMLLRMSGHDVQVAQDGPMALGMAAALRPDIVLLDIGLPGMDGYELARRIRELPELGAVQLIAVTGHGREADRQAAAAAGFHAFITKPVDPEELARLVN
ncbi:PAS domain S-box protein [Azohydromonas lata]|uniref:PAS domain S-box protein n=1 Tax=Azohydromonas lata TaxID=45677 RepID=UPI0012F4E30F|nr:PAS domain S-box protein [Azohydromonas lata]